MLQVVAANEVSSGFAAVSLVGMIALQTPLGRAGNGEEAENGENRELHCALSGW
jgi:hypothetical protein